MGGKEEERERTSGFVHPKAGSSGWIRNTDKMSILLSSVTIEKHTFRFVNLITLKLHFTLDQDKTSAYYTTSGNM